MRVLITGSTGFAGRHVLPALRTACPDAAVLATAHLDASDAGYGIAKLDVSDGAAVERAVKEYSPTHVLHLASIAAPAQAGAEFLRTWDVNTLGTLHMCRAIIQHAPHAWLLNVGSGLAYGFSAGPGHAIDETAALAPMDNYGASKAAADLAVGALANQGLKAIRLRPFNHAGPGQSEKFVVPAFAAQIARIEAGQRPPVIRVGNLKAERDFLDVRDVAAAYVKAVFLAASMASGTVLNLASGTPRTIASVLDGLLALAQVSIAVEQDDSRMRPSDVPRMMGDAARARRLLAWHPVRTFDETLRDTLDDWRQRVRDEV